MKKSLLILPILLGLAALACSGTLTALVGPPVYLCPTAVAATALPLPTVSGQPTVIPLPTALPAATLTPMMIVPPEPFYRGDAVFTRSPQAARFRLMTVTTVNTPGGRSVAVWEIEVRNLSGGQYDLFPAYQSYVSQLTGGMSGVWGASADAAVAAHLSLVDLEAVALTPGQTRTFTLAAFNPYGSSPDRITLMLDPTTRPTPPPRLPGSNPLVWRLETNPYCAGTIADPPVGVLPPG
jgi:hypothetical protein